MIEMVMVMVMLVMTMMREPDGQNLRSLLGYSHEQGMKAFDDDDDGCWCLLFFSSTYT
jgi:hypothetical protein